MHYLRLDDTHLEVEDAGDLPLGVKPEGHGLVPIDLHSSVHVRPMRYADIPKVVATNRKAFVHDPLLGYMLDTPDAPHSRGSGWVDNVVYALQYFGHAHARKVLVVDVGDAFLYFGLPGNKPTTLETLMLRTISFIRKSRTAEQRKRIAEVMSKQDAAIKSALGDKIQRMFAVEGLATHPNKQGRGYGSALMAAANAKADALGVASWLSSSNIANTAFYESCGFAVVKEFAIGEDNPTWTEPPVIVRIMARERMGGTHDAKSEMV